LDSTHSVPDFVGAQRHAYVDLLVDMFEGQLGTDAAPRLVTFEAPTGWGKTRIVQEFYARIAARQAEPRYWPATIQEPARPEHGGTLQGARKLIYPEAFAPEAGSNIEFLWWGLTATRRQAGVMPVQALAEDATQLQAHRPALKNRCRMLATHWERIHRSVRRNRGEIASQAASTVADAGVAGGMVVLGLSVAAPPAGLVAGVAAAVLMNRVLSRGAEDRRSGGSEDFLDASREHREDLVGPLVEEVADYAQMRIPVVIVVEDIHTADASLVDLLVRLLDGASVPILVVATGWPGFLDEPNRPAHRLLTDVPANRIRRTTIDQLGQLDESDRAALAKSVSPELDPRDAAVLARKFPNPLALQLALGTRRVRSAIETGTLAAEIQLMPHDLKGIYRVQWEELPPPLRNALTLALLSSPDGVRRLSTAEQLIRGASWDPELIRAAAEATPWLRTELADLKERLQTESIAYGWASQVDEWLRVWLEPSQRDVAADDREAFCADSDLEVYYERLAEHIDVRAEVPPARRIASAQLLVTLALEDFTPWGPRTAIAADILIASLADQSDASSKRQLIGLIGRIPTTDERGAPDFGTLHRQRYLARALVELERYEEAVPVLDELVRRSRDLLHPLHPETIESRLMLIDALGSTGNLDRAVTQARALLTGLSDDSEDSRGLRLAAGTALGRWLLASGNAMSAMVATRDVLTSSTEDSGDGHTARILAAERVLADALEQFGDPEGALVARLRLHARAVELHGLSHPETISLFLQATVKWFPSERAFSELEGRIQDLAASVGQDHPQVLRLRSSLVEMILGPRGGSESVDARLRERTIRIAMSLQGDLAKRHGRSSREVLALRRLILRGRLGLVDACKSNETIDGVSCDALLADLHALHEDCVQYLGAEDQLTTEIGAEIEHEPERDESTADNDSQYENMPSTGPRRWSELETHRLRMRYAVLLLTHALILDQEDPRTARCLWISNHLIGRGPDPDPLPDESSGPSQPLTEPEELDVFGVPHALLVAFLHPNPNRQAFDFGPLGDARADVLSADVLSGARLLLSARHQYHRASARLGDLPDEPVSDADDPFSYLTRDYCHIAPVQDLVGLLRERRGDRGAYSIWIRLRQLLFELDGLPTALEEDPDDLIDSPDAENDPLLSGDRTTGVERQTLLLHQLLTCVGLSLRHPLCQAVAHVRALLEEDRKPLVQVVGVYESLADGLARVFGALDLAPLIARREAAYLLGCSGDSIGAAERCRAILRDAGLTNSPEFAGVFIRGDLAFWTARAGDSRGAFNEYRAFVAENEALFGTNDPYAQVVRDLVSAVSREEDDAINPSHQVR